mgnify:CR=1 FL=1
MREALKLAAHAAQLGEVPVGALIVSQDQVLGSGFNQRESLNNPLAHAEILAIETAAKAKQAWRLSDCTLYVTLEPCPMCAGAILNSRISRVVYAAPDPKAGAAGSLFNLLQDSRLNHRCEVSPGICQKESAELLSSFFLNLRRKKKNC